MARSYKPLYEDRRFYPAAMRIAAAMLADPALMRLRTRRLVSDIRQRYHVSVAYCDGGGRVCP